MVVREDINGKKNIFFRPESLKPLPPLTPIRATCLFSDVEIQDLKVTCGEGREIYKQPKKQLKAQYIFEEIDSFYFFIFKDAFLAKRAKNSSMGRPPPLH